jgi:hypothetical protein
MKDYVQVYRNLNKKLGHGDYPVYSIRGDDGLVKKHTCHIMLEDCSLRVGKKGKQRVRDEKRKNVHAYVQGREIHSINVPVFYDHAVPISYNPYKNDTFIRTDTGETVHKAKCVLFGCGKDARQVMAML